MSLEGSASSVYWANGVFLDGGHMSWAELRDAAIRRWGRPESGVKIAVVADSDEIAYQAVAWFLETMVDGVLIGSDRMNDAIQDVLDAQGYTVIDGNAVDDAVAGGQERRLSIFTSGTTGTPKLVGHTWDTLNTLAARRSTTPHRWLVPYAIGTYAWYQMVCLGVFGEDQHLIPGPAHDAVQLFGRAARHGATAISATPTFWRFALSQVHPDTLQAVPLRQLSLGGETVDQRILDDLTAAFPEARLTHIYASTEVGACIVVADRKAGFPGEWLGEDKHRNYQLRLAEGRLHVRSRFAAPDAGTDDGWIDTGDLVEERQGRVYFLGRADNSMINVGGNKAYPADIEATLLAHPDVRWTHVSARRAPLIGHLAAAQVVLEPGSDHDVMEERLTKFCGQRLPEYAVPRVWEFLDAVPMEPSLKTGMAEV